RDSVFDTATRGLLAYRLGEFSRGRELYQAAIGMADREGWPVVASMASLILARQELAVGGNQAATIVGDALRRSATLDEPWVGVWRSWLMHEVESPHVGGWGLRGQLPAAGRARDLL